MKPSSAAIFGILSAAWMAALGLYIAKPGLSVKANESNHDGPRRPVLLELFTSEGCSSCPPADRLLETLDRTQPVAGADLIVLSEHVDYWNRLGWSDPFSSHVFTQRQQDYVNRLHLEGAYTPQLVIDGRKDVIGSDERAARNAILDAEKTVKAAIGLSAKLTEQGLKVMVRVDGGPKGMEVYLALADDRDQSQVTRGENSGRTLGHVAVVRSLTLAGRSDGAFSKELTLPLKDGNGGARRIVAFLQDPATKRILGAAQIRL